MSDTVTVSFEVPVSTLRSWQAERRELRSSYETWVFSGDWGGVIEGLAKLAALDTPLPPEPIKVGELAMHTSCNEVRIDYIGRHRALGMDKYGGEFAYRIGSLTGLGEPAPEDWGQA